MSNTALRIAIIGAGGIGSTFAFQLARMGRHQVTVIARPTSLRLQQLQRDQAIVNIKNERAEVQVSGTLDETIPYDLILVTLQAQQIEALLPALHRSQSRWIQFMGNSFNPEHLQEAIGAERCSFGMPFLQATIRPDGKLEAKIGVGGQKSKMNHQPWVDLFRNAGLPAVYEPNMLLWLRCHAPLGAAFEGICAAGMKRNGGATWAEARRTARGLQETLALIQRLGYKLYPNGKRMLHSAPPWIVASMLWAVTRIPSFRKLLATGINECRGLVGAFVQAAPNANPPVSVATIQGLLP